MIRNILVLIGLICLIYISFSSESATAVNNNDPDRFSATSAAAYLDGIATAPHPIGSAENQKVRDYIAQTLIDIGLEVRVEKGYVNSSWKPTFMQMAYVENIIATLKGSDPTAKKVVLAGHYDSVFGGPGAADDGYAIASMIETVKMLKDQQRKNDIELVITDGEEMGLLGAKHYAENNDLSQIGILLNFEARGNAGPGIAFEFSENNAWLVKEMSRVSKRPIASSLSYEVYKRMPNGTDFMVFSDYGVQGINYAFIDGFSYYHNPIDNIENLSLESVQHTGENMYRMAKHFANYDFGPAPEGNASFFNFYGKLIYYAAQYDLYILIFSLCLFLFTTYRSLQLEEVNLKRIIISFFTLLAIFILIIAINFGLALLIVKAYPQYSTFYSYQYYNHEWYLLAGIGLTLLFCWWTGSKINNRFKRINVGLGTILLLTMLSILTFIYAPTGIYLMMYPMLALTIGLLLSVIFNLKNENWQSWVLGIGMSSVMLGFWSTVSHNLYLGFSIFALPGAIIPTALFCFASISLLSSLWKKKEYLIPIFGICLLSYSMINAHLRSKPSEKKPLKSNLFFVSDRSTSQNYWASRDHYINEGHLNLLDNAEKRNLPKHLTFSRFMKKSDLSADRFASEFMIDSIPDNKSVLIKVTNPKRAGKASLIFNEVKNVDKILIDGQLNKQFLKGSTGYFATVLFGIGLDSMEVEIVKRDTANSVATYFNFNYQESLKEEKMPKGIVRSEELTYVSELLQF